MSEILDRLKRAPVVPLVVPDDVATAIRTTEALVAGGLTVIEIVLRTPAAVKCLGAVARAVPAAIVGAGTVLTPEQARAVIAEGVQFVVCPGLNEPIVELVQQAGLPIFPGVATATEAQSAYNLGLRTVKFFPASLAGGPAMIKALASVFKDLSFMPTGGVSAENLSEYLSLPSVIACGGSWLTPKTAIDQGNYDEITALAAEAVNIARSVRG